MLWKFNLEAVLGVVLKSLFKRETQEQERARTR